MEPTNIDISKFLSPAKSRQNIKSLFKHSCSAFVLLMLEEGILADITLNAKGGSVKAHRFVLSCVSPVFCAMFEHDMCDTSCVNMCDMTIDALQLFLILLYTVPNTDEYSLLRGVHLHLLATIDKHFVEFYDAVRKYQVEETLENVLKYALMRNLSLENCWHYYARGKIPAEFGSLDYVCFSFIMYNYEDVVRSQETQKAMNRDSALVHELWVQALDTAKRAKAIEWFGSQKQWSDQFQSGGLFDVLFGNIANT